VSLSQKRQQCQIAQALACPAWHLPMQAVGQTSASLWPSPNSPPGYLTSATQRVFGIVLVERAWVPFLWRLEVANVYRLRIRVRLGCTSAAFRDASLADWRCWRLRLIQKPISLPSQPPGARIGIR
jgi:hypothetical protein